MPSTISQANSTPAFAVTVERSHERVWDGKLGDIDSELAGHSR